MMTNIFNTFDPSTNFMFSMNWLSMMIFIFFMPLSYWVCPSRFAYFWLLLFKFLTKEFKILLNYNYSNLLTFLTLFMFIFWNNFMGLFPYIFTSSSHMSFNLSLSLNLWIGIMLYGWINFFNHMMTHLTPMNTPPTLMSFMVIIELTSQVIRPITLSVRLSANMIAGHLLLSLLGSSGQQITNLIFFNLFMITQLMLFILEISVSMIQAYVFSVLSLLYSSEI